MKARPTEEDLVPLEIEQVLRDFANNRESGQVILNLNRGAIESYKMVRYVRVIDKERNSRGK